MLEKERKRLKKRMARLKHEMWGMKFDADEASKINEIIINAVGLNKNPAMLGAFSSVEQIRDETAKIEFAHKSLDQVSEIIEKYKNQAAESASG